MGRARDIASLLTTSSALATDSEVASLYTPLSSPVSSYKNKIINGEFDIWQRGTSFSAGGYTADRWLLQVDGAGATRSVSRQTLTPGSITGYESAFFLRYNQSVAGTSATFNIIDQRIEDVRILAGQTVTVSFWAKADSTRTITSSIQQIFGTGGSSEVAGLASGNINITTSWTRYSYTGTLESISGKTIGTDSYAAFRINLPINTTFTVDIWGVQVERGSIATEFEQRFINDELRMCQRYYEKSYGSNVNPGTITDDGQWIITPGAIATGAIAANFTIHYVVPKRYATTSITYYSPVTGASGVVRNRKNNATAAVDKSTGLYINNGGETSWVGGFGSGTGATEYFNDATSSLAFHWTSSAEL
jgi:hypothetical protein